MEQLFLFFNVSDLDGYHFHENFLCNEHAVLIMWAIALIVGAAVSAAFYFGCCNSQKEKKYANIQTWIVSMVVAAVVTFCIADFAIIGLPGGTESIYSFYQCNEDYLVEEYPDNDPDYNNACDTKDQIAEDLDNYGDIRLHFDIAAVIWALLASYGLSFYFKKKTINGTHIPHV